MRLKPSSTRLDFKIKNSGRCAALKVAATSFWETTSLLGEQKCMSDEYKNSIELDKDRIDKIIENYCNDIMCLIKTSKNSIHACDLKYIKHNLIPNLIEALMPIKDYTEFFTLS